ncbi:hypothetical protein SPFM15_00163 [Salmonella phage SPFM15]|nr:hypothetical protein SPFM5_00158 [Salmonella phage SPFM5]VFR13787.1 hypothetical protein SPFM15_00163 [Salmonella phage SPFM15]
MYLIATGHHRHLLVSYLIEIGEWFGYEVIFLRQGEVVLMCYCPPGKFCHQRYLQKLSRLFDEDTDKLIENFLMDYKKSDKGPDAEAAYTNLPKLDITVKSGLKYLAPDWAKQVKLWTLQLAKWRIAEKRTRMRHILKRFRRKKKR